MKKTVLLAKKKDLDPVKTFECGQCFRWNMDDKGDYYGVVGAHAARVFIDGEDVYIESDTDELWSEYFDLATDYAAITDAFHVSEYMDECIEFGYGIRLLRQDRWEALCSFIISQCNNIPRIKGIVERLCQNFGDKISFEGRDYYTFPTAERIAALSEEDLAPIRSGYRAAYIISAARAVAEGRVDLEALSQTDCDASLRALKSLNGVGTKVANCANLFGLGHMEAFPIDVWMKRALKEHFPKDFDPKTLGSYAGLAQQYIFYYARSGEN